MTAGNTPDGARARPQDFACNSDAALEVAIKAAANHLVSGLTGETLQQAWLELKGLIEQRSVSQVRFMERMRGLG